MEPTSPTPEHQARLPLALLAAMNILFILSFLGVLYLATTKARAQDTACTAANLLAEAEADVLKRIRQDATATPNGEGLLWRVEKGTKAPSFLFGTMHLSDPRVLEMPPAATAAFNEAQTIVIETTDVLDRKKMMAAMAENPSLTMFPPGKGLQDYLTREQQETVSDALAARGVPLGSVAKMKPWMLMSLISLPECEVQRQKSGAVVLDVELARNAEAAGKRLVGLESFAEQLAALTSLPMDLHVQGLVATLQLGSRMDDMMETLTALYLSGETGMFMPATKELLKSDAETAESYAAFEETMINARNRLMADRAAPILEEGGAFIAVGAMHLPGESGLVELLRDKGYEVEYVE